jgi:hypothetical protein
MQPVQHFRASRTAMVASVPSPRAATIRYILSHKLLAGDRVGIELDLYRGAVLILTRTIAEVSDAELGPVTLKCRSYLERRGAEPLASAPPSPSARIVPPMEPARPRAARVPGKPQPVAAPVAAFDWLFAG